MKVIRYPADLTDSKKNYPFVKISLVKYYHTNIVIDSERFASNLRDISNGTVQQQSNSIFSTFNQAKAGVFGKTKKKDLGIQLVLPLPTSMEANWSPNWEMADTRLLSAVTSAEGVADALGNIAGFVASTILERAQQVLSGTVPNPRKQALFNQIDPRNFQFNWIFSPETEREANTVQEIIRTFATYSLPKVMLNESQFQFPAEFEFSFHNIEGAPKISKCVCTGVSTSMNPNSLQLTQSGHPVQSALSLSFMETDLRTQDSPGI